MDIATTTIFVYTGDTAGDTAGCNLVCIMAAEVSLIIIILPSWPDTIS